MAAIWFRSNSYFCRYRTCTLISACCGELREFYFQHALYVCTHPWHLRCKQLHELFLWIIPVTVRYNLLVTVATWEITCGTKWSIRENNIYASSFKSTLIFHCISQSAINTRYTKRLEFHQSIWLALVGGCLIRIRTRGSSSLFQQTFST